MKGQFDPQEAALFGVLVDVLATNEVERPVLRVRVASRGVTLGRPFLRFFELGLIEERVVRPGFLRRLLGGKDRVWIRLTASGLQLGAEMFPARQPVAETDPVPEAPAPAEVAEPEPQPQPEPKAEPVPEPEPEAPAPLPDRPTRFQPSDFTETLGGAPLASTTIPASERLDGLAELLGLLGFEFIEAGAFLADRRMAEGQSDAEIALEVVVTALAHAARLRETGTIDLNHEAALLLIAEIETMFGRLVPDGMLEADLLTAAVTGMRSFVQDPADRSGLDEFLADPLRGVAPPAICPEAIYQPVHQDED